MNEKIFRTTQSWSRWMSLALPIGLGLLCLALWAWGTLGGTSALAAGDIWYVDVASGTDQPACGAAGDPCRTISYTLSTRAAEGDSLRVAQGIYTESLSINYPVMLEGGYEATGWTRDILQYETILDRSGVPTVFGDWDGASMYAPVVITDSGKYKMWYTGSNQYHNLIGYAESDDGIHWARYANNPVLEIGTPGEWDDQEIGQPSVIKRDGQYQMWYFGANTSYIKQIGYATSSDGLTWTKYEGNPVLTVGAPGEWDESEVGGPRVVFDGEMYHLWYHGYVGDCCDSLGYATSLDGIAWTKHPSNPVFGPGEPGEWDDSFIFFTAIISETDAFDMWYSIGEDQGGIGYVTSTNGITWTRFLTGPVLQAGGPGEWDETYLFAPTVIHDQGLYHMWYVGYSNNWEYDAFGYATSTDGITWTKSLSNPVMLNGTPTQWSGTVVEFTVNASGSVLDGFTITGGSDPMAGGVNGHDAFITLRNCLITGNYAIGAPWNQGAGGILGGLGGGGVTLENCRIVDNEVGEGAGGVRVHQGTLVVTNTLITDNHGDVGIHVNGPLSLMHVTVANNEGGIVFNPPPSTTLTVVNSIVYQNGWGIGAAPETNTTVTYSDIEGGGWEGEGNLDADPEFVSPASGDYHLLGNSPMIDAGTPVNSPLFDLDGTLRDMSPDMGAYEFERFNHDVAVVDTLPAGAVAVNVPVPVRATIFNTGLLAQDNIPITCQFTYEGSPVYTQTVTSAALASLDWQVLTFPDFTPTAQGQYQFTCASALPGDENPANDEFSRNLAALDEIADVWSKDNPEDDGTTPSDLDSWYESPDVWVRNSPDGGLIHQDPIAGITNTVYVRLRNRGTVVISGTVDVYWIEPSLGVRCGDWAYIDTLAFSDLAPGEVRILNVAWIPSRTGHTCLQNVIDSPDDPFQRPLECSPLWVPWDNNVGWHNVNIIANPSGGVRGPQDILTSEANLVNVYNLPKAVDLIIERQTFPASGSITVTLPASLFDRWLASPGSWQAGLEVITATRQIAVTGLISATIGGIPLEAAEKAIVGLTFEGMAGLEFEAAVRERIDGVTIGGVSYQWRIPDTTPPTVQSVSPLDSAEEVALDAPIVITFDEPVSPLTFQLTVTNDPGGWQFFWNDDSTAVTAVHTPFTAITTFSLSVTASDAATNAMVAPYSWSFTTQYQRLYLPLVLR